MGAGMLPASMPSCLVRPAAPMLTHAGCLLLVPACCRAAIADEVGVPAPSQRLIFAGRRLEDGHTLGDCGLQHESTVLLVLALRGMPGGGDPGPGPFQIFVIDLVRAVACLCWAMGGLQSTMGGLRPELRLLRRLQERKSHTFSVGPDTTVGELKQGEGGGCWEGSVTCPSAGISGCRFHHVPPPRPHTCWQLFAKTAMQASLAGGDWIP